MIIVSFVYDAETKHWDPIVNGCGDYVEARQAFNAVVLTMKALDWRLFDLHLVTEVKDGGFRITPAVQGEPK